MMYFASGEKIIWSIIGPHIFFFDINVELRAAEHFRFQYGIVHYVLFTDLIVSLPMAVFLDTADM